MAAVLDAPVTADRVGEPLHAHGQAADVVAHLDGLFAVAYAHERHHADRLQALPQPKPGSALGAGIWM